ncbi:MAG: hypothetical protein M0P47_03715 [Bacteroidales bacterium]|jgi:hypothetical protein|nr:hypothetical protein [Bacteroidales bacterium]
MKKYQLKIIVVIFLVSLTGFSSVFSQNQEKITGTIGNEKMGNDRIVICVYGSAACLPVNVDTNMTVKFNNKKTKLSQLPFGLYLDARIIRDAQGKDIVKDITIDEDKTVICFTRLKEGQDKQLSEILSSIKGVKNFKLNKKSNQVYIEYDHKIIKYSDLEGQIKKAGFELE